MKKCLAALLLLQLFACKPAQKSEQTSSDEWWKESVVYQLYPRSFKDSNGDGVGDLKGIISKLDYLQSLGIDVIWLNPIYASPNYDNGYDISNYREINPEFGTMADFDELLKGLHQRHIKLIMDMVVNHSSSAHDWFKQAKSSRDNPYRNYYH
jgi:oligo-1,6-glucosidase